MKDRQKRMLRFLLMNEGSLLIDDLAKTFSVGRRTVSRDLDVLENWLSLKGASLERKQNQGIRILFFGSSSDKLLEIVNKPDSYLESLPAVKRQKLIFLYLLFNNREIKISDMANTFFISDTSVWNDLNNIDKTMVQKDIELERLKGVGIRLFGAEKVIRMKFLSTLMDIFSSRTIIPHLYNLKEGRESTLEINQFNILMERLHFPVGNQVIQELIKSASRILGYSFTMSGEALLYFYLQLTLHRVKSGAMIEERPDVPCSEDFLELADSMLCILFENILSGTIPKGEIAQLAMILQVLEIGDLKSIRLSHFELLIDEKVQKLTSEMIEQFGELDKQLYYLNRRMEEALSLSLASLIVRTENQIPYWHGDWGNVASDEWRRREKEEIVSQLIYKSCGVKADKKDLEYILILFHSLVISSRDIPARKIRCLVCCFEGIGLASYLQSVLQREIKAINVVEATAVFKIRQEYIDNNGIELIISTFPIPHIDIPVIVITLPLNKEKIKSEIASLLPLMVRKENSLNGTQTNRKNLVFMEVMRLIEDFSILSLEEDLETDEILYAISSHLLLEENMAQALTEDFRKREELGTLEFEDYGIRVFHCKSSTVLNPIAGVVEFPGEETKRILFMVAPDPCADSIRKLLSIITVSFLENSNFRRAIMNEGLQGIRKNLMDVYKELI